MSSGPPRRRPKPEPRFFVYKMTNDDGGAPCVKDGLLSLAICKPRIRTSAHVGDVIFAFAANSLFADNRLIYIARVTKVVDNGRYYKDARFRGRPDRIYLIRDGTYSRRAEALYHEKPENLLRDLGAGPEHASAVVLLSDDFRYFGGSGTDEYKESRVLRELIESLKQGHLVNHNPEVLAALARLRDVIWAATTKRVIGKPTSEPDARACHRGGGSLVVCR